MPIQAQGRETPVHMTAEPMLQHKLDNPMNNIHSMYAPLINRPGRNGLLKSCRSITNRQ